MKKILFLPLMALLFTACGDSSTTDPTTGETLTEHYLLGNASKATKEATNTDNFLVVKKQFVMSYNNSLGRANWVAWRSAPEWNGTITRKDDFSVDTDLPSSFYRVGPSAFAGTGFDRGHLCPSADRDKTSEDNSATFAMSNMIAQAPNVNQDAWEKLESYCRNLVKSGKELYIIAGPRGEGGSGSNGGTTKRIDNGRVIVPSHCWKIVVILDQGSDDLSRINENTRVIALDIANKQSEGTKAWGGFRVSVRDIEASTGYNFLSQLPKSVQDAIEKKVDNGPTQ